MPGRFRAPAAEELVCSTWDKPDSWRKMSLRFTSRHQSASRRLLAGFSFRVRWRESCCSWSNQACRAWPEQTHVVVRGTGLHRVHAVRAMFINAAGTFLSSDRPSCHHGDGNATPVSFFDGELASRAFPRSGAPHEVAPNHPRITTALTLVAGPTMPSRRSRPGR